MCSCVARGLFTHVISTHIHNFIMSRKSSRNVAQKSYRESASYPDGPAQSTFEKLVQRLDIQGFLSNDYARVDSAITRALFSTKRRSGSYRALVLEDALPETEASIPKTCALSISQICKSSISQASPTYKECQSTAISIQSSFPEIFSINDITILTQYVSLPQGFVNYYLSLS